MVYNALEEALEEALDEPVRVAAGVPTGAPASAPPPPPVTDDRAAQSEGAEGAEGTCGDGGAGGEGGDCGEGGGGGEAGDAHGGGGDEGGYGGAGGGGSEGGDGGAGEGGQGRYTPKERAVRIEAATAYYQKRVGSEDSSHWCAVFVPNDVEQRSYSARAVRGSGNRCRKAPPPLGTVCGPHWRRQSFETEAGWLRSFDEPCCDMGRAALEPLAGAPHPKAEKTCQCEHAECCSGGLMRDAVLPDDLVCCSCIEETPMGASRSSSPMGASRCSSPMRDGCQPLQLADGCQPQQLADGCQSQQLADGCQQQQLTDGCQPQQPRNV